MHYHESKLNHYSEAIQHSDKMTTKRAKQFLLDLFIYKYIIMYIMRDVGF